MSKLLLAFFCLVMSLLVAQSNGTCTCNVSSNGEYCGSELNRINGNQDCTRDQYLCGSSNKNKVLFNCQKTIFKL